jgi:2,4-dienoyl-CoA reductase-like NADH-dependent reductase (Old Yellow Enzyme family)
MSILFEPTRIGNIEIKNRFIRSATYYALSDIDGFIGEASVELMKTLAENNVGLIVSGYAFVQKYGQVFPDMNGIDRDEHIPSYQKMTKAVHDAGGRIVMQIAHGGSRARTAATLAADGDGRYLAVSMTKPLENKKRSPDEMTDADIEEIIEAFGKAAGRVREAGFDGVQIHGAHGYLVTQFLSPLSNLREDKWGGTPEKRARFLIEVIRSIKRVVGTDYPVLIKLGCHEYVSGDDGLPVEEGAEAARLAESEGVCHIEVSHGGLGRPYSKGLAGVTSPEQEAFMLPDVKAVREKTSGPVGLVGGLRSLRVMEQIIESGACDHIAICRPFIREPDLMTKYINGEKTTADCISCGGCFNTDKAGINHIFCSQLEKGK